jgi:hypothetical protein
MPLNVWLRIAALLCFSCSLSCCLIVILLVLMFTFKLKNIEVYYERDTFVHHEVTCTVIRSAFAQRLKE